MAIRTRCERCRVKIEAPDRYAGRKAECPNCGALFTVPAAEEEIVDAEIVPQPAPPQTSPWEIPFLDDLHGPHAVREFHELPGRTPSPPAAAAAATPDRGGWMRRMFVALLDPRSIQWLLTLGGGLMVLGALIWLISKGVLEDPLVLAVVLGAVSLGVLLGGWYVTLKTRFQIAGRALTFLGCVVAPLNLWFYHVQGLLLLEHGLWVGGLACVALYAATVWALRDGLFMYAVEAGITLTAVLLLGSFGLADHATHLCILLTALALVSIHAPQLFSANAETFTRKRFGMPLFWCGHAQLGAALVILAVTQVAGWLPPLGDLFDLPPEGILITTSHLAPALLWLAGAYAYLYSDLAVRRIGVYTYLAAVCLVLAEVTFAGLELLGVDGLVATLAVTATAVSLLARLLRPDQEGVTRAIAPLALVLSFVPVGIGLLVHLRATSEVALEVRIDTETTWTFLAAMLTVAVANRISAFLYQAKSRSLAAVYFFFSALALLMAAAGLLRMLDLSTWQQQAPVLMLIPIGYLIASRLWRGRNPERPLGWVAHAAAAVLLVHVALGVATELVGKFVPSTHLVVAVIAAEAAIFYGLAAWIRRKSANLYFAVVAACVGVWQLMLYATWPQEVFAIFLAFAGLALLIAARQMGLSDVRVFDAGGRARDVPRGRGVALLRAGHAMLLVALTISFLDGLVQMLRVGLQEAELAGIDWIALGLATLASAAAAFLSRSRNWRSTYTVAAVALAALTFLTINIAIDLSLWRKLEIFLVGVGLIMLGASYVGHFREEADARNSDSVSFGLWLGSLLSAMPLLLAVFYHWADKWEFSLYDEIALLTVTLLMLATGIVWRVKASTLLGGTTLATYLVVLIVSLLYRPQVAIGIYLAAGGAVLFGVGLLLSIYRGRLVALPQRISEREGMFQVISWR